MPQGLQQEACQRSLPCPAAQLFFLKGRLTAPFMADEATKKPWGD
jgi:hypothetical protein